MDCLPTSQIPSHRRNSRQKGTRKFTCGRGEFAGAGGEFAAMRGEFAAIRAEFAGAGGSLLK
eukprot:6029448-Pyramimonas_sp.AAC.1